MLGPSLCEVPAPAFEPVLPLGLFDTVKTGTVSVSQPLALDVGIPSQGRSV